MEKTCIPGHAPFEGELDEGALYRSLLERLYDGVYFVDRERRITFWNSSAEAMAGYPKERIIGSLCHDNLLRHIDGAGRRLCMDECPLAYTLQDGVSREVAGIYLHHRLGHRVPIHIRITPILDAHGTVIGAAEVFRESSASTEVSRRLKELELLVGVDRLTEVPNRTFLEEILERYRYDAVRANIPFGALFLDIDRFKTVNDQFGHAAGDAVLKSVAKTLSSNIRPTDSIARWGGEEFVMVFPEITESGLLSAAEKLRMLVEPTDAEANDGKIRVTVSIGATMFRAGETVESLIRRADRLMYESKNMGRNRITFE